MADPALTSEDVWHYERTLRFAQPKDDGRAHVRRHLKGWLRLVLWNIAINPDREREWRYCAQCLIGGVPIEATAELKTGVECENTSTAKKLHKGVTKAIAGYMEFGAIVRVLHPEEGCRVQPLHAKDEGKKIRVLADLSQYLNDEQPHYRLRYENIRHALRLVRKGCYFWKEDLSKCYFSFELHPAVRKFYYMRWGGLLLGFLRVPFGDAKAPRVVTSLLDLVSNFARGATETTGFRPVLHSRYIDDFFGNEMCSGEAAESGRLLRGLLRKVGLTAAPHKSEGPDQVLEFIGVGFDSRRGALFITKEKRERSLRELNKIQIEGRASGKTWEKLAGLFNFISLALPQLRPFYRSFCEIAAKAERTMRKVDLEAASVIDVRLCINILGSIDSTYRWKRNYRIEIASDGGTSGAGIGGTVIKAPEAFRKVCARSGTRLNYSGLLGSERHLRRGSGDVQFSEIMAVLVGLMTYYFQLRGEDVHWRCDNSAVVAITGKWSTRDPALRLVLRAIACICIQGGIGLYLTHIAGKDNVVADHWSRPALHRLQLHHPLYGSSHLYIRSDIDLSELDPSDPHTPYRISLRISSAETRTWTL